MTPAVAFAREAGPELPASSGSGGVSQAPRLADDLIRALASQPRVGPHLHSVPAKWTTAALLPWSPAKPHGGFVGAAGRILAALDGASGRTASLSFRRYGDNFEC